MKKLLPVLTLLLLLPYGAGAQITPFCDTTSNVIVYSNYDGGILNLNIDQNIPNLKIGIVTYEAAQINISGPFAGNVTAVWYAGYNGTNDNCNLGVTNTTISGVPNPVDSILIYPPATVSDPNGSPNMVCGYSCSTGNQGGCNTAQQVTGFFMTKFGSTSIRFHRTNYPCFPSSTVDISSGGNCCLVPIINAVEPEPESVAIRAYPNPATVGEQVTIETLPAGKLDVRLLDVLGRVVYSTTLYDNNQQTRWNVPLTGLAAGVYMLDIHAGRQQLQTKLQVH